jgi:hypothetical protein
MAGTFGNDPMLDYKIANNIKDLNKLKTPKNKSDTQDVYSIIFNNEEFSLTKYLIQLAKLEYMFSDAQFNSTFFLCPDEKLEKCIDINVLRNMDLLTARNLLLYNTLNGLINTDTLRSSTDLKLITRIPYEVFTNMYMTIFNGQILLNNKIVVEKEIEACNGLIHLTSEICIPDTIDVVMCNKEANCNPCGKTAGNYLTVNFR